MSEVQAFLPEFFEGLLADQYGTEDVRRVLEGCSVQRKVTLRANTLKASRDQVAAALAGAGVGWSAVPWYDDAFVIEDAREPVLRELPEYEQGAFYLQSLSSMIPALVLDAQPGEDVLDMCAAPGGKTTQIMALSGGKAYLSAVEMHAPRAEKLEHNLRKLGASNVTVMRADARRLDDFFSFDRILVDAPCSGSGTLRATDPRTAERFTLKLVEKSMKAQRALLAKALGLLRPGGTLVYSTCSVLACENEDALADALARASRRASFEISPAAASLPGHAGCMPVLPTKLEGTLALCPTERYEGFFIAEVKRVA